jgi:hypothetical protein
MTAKQIVDEIRRFVEKEGWKALFHDSKEKKQIWLQPPGDKWLLFDAIQAIYFHENGEVPEGKDGIALSEQVNVDADIARFFALAMSKAGGYCEEDGVQFIRDLRQDFLSLVEISKKQIDESLVY